MKLKYSGIASMPQYFVMLNYQNRDRSVVKAMYA